MRRHGVSGRMFAAVMLAAVLATAAPSLTPGPEVVLDPLFFRVPTEPLSIGGTRDAIVVTGTAIVGNALQAFYQIVDSAPHDRVFLTGRSQSTQVVTSGTETLVAWRDPSGTQILFPLHPDAVAHHVDNGIFFFAIPTPDGFRVFAHDLFANVSSVTINADGSSVGASVDLLYAMPPAVQSRTHFVFGGVLFQPALLVTPVGQTSVQAIEGPRVFNGYISGATNVNADSAVFLSQTTIGIDSVAVDLAGEPRVTASQRIFTSDAIIGPVSMAWTGTNYVVVWSEKGADRTHTVRGLLLDGDGKPAGAPFTIAANAEAPVVAGLGRAEAAVVYVDTDAALLLPRLVLRRLSPPVVHRRAVR
jgi:hypothetical protein